jgi:hypothetical protein
MTDRPPRCPAEQRFLRRARIATVLVAIALVIALATMDLSPECFSGDCAAAAPSLPLSLILGDF